MHPAGFVEFNFDAIRRSNLVGLAVMLNAVAKLEKNFPHPLATVFKGGFFAGKLLRVNGECQKQLAANIGQAIPYPREHLVNADGMKPRLWDKFLDGLFTGLVQDVTSTFPTTAAVGRGVYLRDQSRT